MFFPPIKIKSIVEFSSFNSSKQMCKWDSFVHTLNQLYLSKNKEKEIGNKLF